MGLKTVKCDRFSKARICITVRKISFYAYQIYMIYNFHTAIKYFRPVFT